MFYVLDDEKNVVPCDLKTWSEMFEDISRRRVAETEIGDYWVSTVLLGLTHDFGDNGEPLIFETMVFAGKDAREDYCTRYATWDEALEGHEKATQWVRDGIKNGFKEDEPFC